MEGKSQTLKSQLYLNEDAISLAIVLLFFRCCHLETEAFEQAFSISQPRLSAYLYEMRFCSEPVLGRPNNLTYRACPRPAG